MDGCVMILLGQWAQHIVTFRWGAADFIAGVGWVYKAHVFLGMTLFLVEPFTRLVHVWSIPVSYMWRPYQVVRSRQPTLRYGPRSVAMGEGNPVPLTLTTTVLDPDKQAAEP